MRIAKRIAATGICSRRTAEAWIEAGRVKVDGVKIASPALNVTPEQVILINGKPLPQVEDDTPRLWLFHKPPGCITSRKDPEGRPTIYTHLPKELGTVLTVGRLDYNTEGLLLLTNSGDLAHALMHPSAGWERTYRVRVFGTVDAAKLKSLENGITAKDKHGKSVTYGPIKAELERTAQGRNAWITMTLREGKNREIRNVCTHLGLEVNKLIRMQYGTFQLGNLPRGEVIEAPQQKVRKLMKT